MEAADRHPSSSVLFFGGSVRVVWRGSGEVARAVGFPRKKSVWRSWSLCSLPGVPWTECDLTNFLSKTAEKNL